MTPEPLPTVIKISATIDLTKDPEEVRVDACSGSAWDDLAYWLEAVGVTSALAGKERGLTKEQVIAYCGDYIRRCLDGYAAKEPASPATSR